MRDVGMIMCLTLKEVLEDGLTGEVVEEDLMRPLSLVAEVVVDILMGPAETEIITARLVPAEAEVVLLIRREFPLSALLAQGPLLLTRVMWIMLRMLGPVELQVQMEILGES
jgi:hypothetical protein